MTNHEIWENLFSQGTAAIKTVEMAHQDAKLDGLKRAHTRCLCILPPRTA